MSDVFKAYGAIKSGNEDSAVLRRQGRVASNQSLAEEAATRREASDFMGRQAAAFAQAGVGSGGTTELLTNQSNVLANLDALNVRYQGEAQRATLRGEAKLVKRRSRYEAAGHLLKFAEKAAYTGGAG